MKFDIKDLKSWSNRQDVKVGDVGFVACDFNTLLTNKATLVTKATIKDIDNNDSRCFLAQPLNGKVIFQYGFFLPVDAVKEDKQKEKKYRPFKSMLELTEVVRGKDWEYNNMSVGDSLLIRRKDDEHFHQNLLITSLGYDENDLISMNGKSMQEWFNGFEFLAQCEWRPFGVEMKEND